MTSALAAPSRAPGVELLGPLSGSGYRQPQALVRRSDGQTVQLTPVLYALLELLDGQRGPAELAAGLSAAIGKGASADDVVTLLDRLRPLGLLDGPEAQRLTAPQPLLGLRWKFVISDPAVTRRITAPFARLFSPFVVVPTLVAFVGVCWFVLVEKGLASATHQAFFQPGLLLAVFLVTVVSAAFHEFGHAAACRYGGAQPGGMGGGLYLVWPAFWTDVGDSYRLSRWGRLRVDLGGLYFNVLVADAVMLAWLVSRQDALLLGIATQLLQMLRQLGPFVRADGYHILADLTGVPDLFHHLRPTMRRLLPWHWKEPSPLRRWARWVVTGWSLVVIPVLAAAVVTGVLLFPRLAATAWAGGRVQVERMADGDPLVVGAALLKLVALTVPVLAIAAMALRLVRRAGDRLWSATADRPRHRAFLVVAVLVALLLVVNAWWPSGQYRVVEAVERDPSATTVTSASGDKQVPALALVPRSGEGEALLLLPDEDGTVQGVLTSVDGSGSAEPVEGRSFPFVLPDAPGPGDNQALAVGDEDGGTVYDIAYALVTVTDGSAVTSSNEAWALASCSVCTTVAVAFQVVLVVGQSDVIAPVNIAVAANEDCFSCVTTALAVQLVATLQEQPSQEVYADLEAALAKLDGLEGLGLEELWAAVQAVEAEVVQVLVDAGLVDAVTTTAASASATPSAGTASAEPSVSPSASAEASTSPSPTPEPQQTSSAPSAEPVPTAAATP